MPSRPQANRCRPVPYAVVLCGGLLAAALLPGTAHAASVGSHRQIISQIIGGSRDERGFTVSLTRAAAAAPRGHNAA